MSTDGQSTKWHRNIAENFCRLSRAHEGYRQTDDRRTGDNMFAKNRSTFGKVFFFWGGEVDCLKRRAPGHCPAERWTRFRSDIWWGSNCCNSITSRLILLDNLDLVIDKHQTGVMSLLSLLDWCYQWLNVNCVTTSFFLGDGCEHSRLFCRVSFGVWPLNPKYLFVSEKKWW